MALFIVTVCHYNDLQIQNQSMLSSRKRGGEGMPFLSALSHSTSIEHHQTEHDKIPAGLSAAGNCTVQGCFLSTGAFPHQPVSSTKASGQSFSSVALRRAQLGEEVPNVLTFSRALPWHQCTAKRGGSISKCRFQNYQMLCWHNWKYSKMFIPNRGSMQAPVFVALTPLHLTSSSITDISLASVGNTAGICKTAVNFRLITSLKSITGARPVNTSQHDFIPLQDLGYNLWFGPLYVPIIWDDHNSMSLTYVASRQFLGVKKKYLKSDMVSMFKNKNRKGRKWCKQTQNSKERWLLQTHPGCEGENWCWTANFVWANKFPSLCVSSLN